MGVENRQLLRAEEAAHLLGIGRTRIYQMIARGEVPVLRIGRGPHIKLAQLSLRQATWSWPRCVV
jgi:excisionase family DNA binding protein